MARVSVMTSDSYVYQTVRSQLWMQWQEELSMGGTNFILQVRGPQKFKVRCVRVLNSAVLYVIKTNKIHTFFY